MSFNKDCCSCEFCGGDWEQSGAEEMNKLQEKSKRKITAMDIQDHVASVYDLVKMCGDVLTYSQLDKARELVRDVLYFHVEKELKAIDEELKNL